MSVKDKEADTKAMTTVINCIVRVLSNVYETVTTHGKEIKKIIEDVTNDKTHRDTLIAELQKKYEDLENKTNQENDRFETCLKEQSDKLEKEFDKKVEDVEIKCDEARQSEMKGTLIVSSPS